MGQDSLTSYLQGANDIIDGIIGIGAECLGIYHSVAGMAEGGSRMSTKFSYKETMEIAQSEKISKKKKAKYLKNIFQDEKFMQWLFNPGKGNPELTQQVMKLYSAFTTPGMIQALIKMVEEERDDLGRSQATFLMSLCNTASADITQMAQKAKQDSKSGLITRSELGQSNRNYDDQTEDIAELVKLTKSIVKGKAKRLASDSELSKTICQIGLTSVPDAKYVDRFKIGFYLNALLSAIYAEVADETEFDKGADWKAYFSEIFGKNNIFEVATFILLEGVNRIDKYDSNAVRRCWESLTKFALKQLDSAPDQLRTQMIELYIKRIDKMFANHTYDLRVDLLDISRENFPRLNGTINKYKDRITDILQRGSTVDR